MSTAQKNPQLQQQLEVMSAAIDSLEKTAALLGERLATVRLTKPSGDPVVREAKATMALCPHATVLSVFRDRIQAIENGLKAVIDELEC